MKKVVYIVIDNYKSKIFRVFENYSTACLYKEKLISTFPYIEIKKFDVD